MSYSNLVPVSVCTCSSLPKLLFCVWHLVVIIIEMQCNFAVFVSDAPGIQHLRWWQFFFFFFFLWVMCSCIFSWWFTTCAQSLNFLTYVSQTKWCERNPSFKISQWCNAKYKGKYTFKKHLMSCMGGNHLRNYISYPFSAKCGLSVLKQINIYSRTPVNMFLFLSTIVIFSVSLVKSYTFNCMGLTWPLINETNLVQSYQDSSKTLWMKSSTTKRVIKR